MVVLSGKFSGAHTIRFKAPIAQVSFLADGSAALVSTSEQLYLLYRQQAGANCLLIVYQCGWRRGLTVCP